jgi:hypothetical protein
MVWQEDTPSRDLENSSIGRDIRLQSPSDVRTGGWLGCLVDVVGGGAYKLEPERVEIDMGKISEVGGVIHLDRVHLDSLRQLRVLNDCGNLETVVDITWVE